MTDGWGCRGQWVGREGGKKPGSRVLLGYALCHPTSRAILSHIDMDQEDSPCLSRPLFAKIVSFRKEERGGRKGETLYWKWQLTSRPIWLKGANYLDLIFSIFWIMGSDCPPPPHFNKDSKTLGIYDQVADLTVDLYALRILIVRVKWKQWSGLVPVFGLRNGGRWGT